MVDPASRLLQDSANSSHHIFIDEDYNEIAESESDTPPLWQTAPLSPNSRTQAIMKGQRELMEMVSNLPESYYELSLKDLVEKPILINNININININNHNNNNNNNNIVEAEESEEKAVNVYPKKKLLQQESISTKRIRSGKNSGLMLNMFYPPIPFRSKKKKIKTTTTETTKKKKNDCSKNTKVSPKPSTSSNICENDKEKEWWKKRSENESTGGVSTSSSSSSGNSRRSSKSSSQSSTSTSGKTNSNSNTNTRNGRRGCWSFIIYKKKKGK